VFVGYGSVTRTVVARPRVDVLLRACVRERRLTVVHAPLGSGKSVAIAGLAGDGQTARLELRPWHRGAFVEGIVDAVRIVRETFGRRTLAALETGAPAEALGELFAADLRLSGEPILITVDNADLLDADTAFATFMDSVLPALPDHARLLVSGRSLGFSPATALARGEAALVDAASLAFTPEEIRALAEAWAVDAGTKRLEEIARESEGWATGVALALESPQMLAPASDGDLARSYLREALVDRLAPPERAFLEAASVYDTLDARVARYDAEIADFEGSLRALQRAGAPMVRTGGTTYRMHALLRSIARERVRERGGEAAAHLRAAKAYSEFGNLAAALFHVARSGDARAIDGFLRAHADTLVRTVHAPALANVLAELDEGSEDIRAYAAALLAKSTGDDRTGALFERARDAAERSGDRRLIFSARAQLVERSLGRLQAVDEGDIAELEARAQSLDVTAHVRAAMYRGWERAVRHDFAGALQALEPLGGLDDLEARFNVSVLYAYAQVASGEIERGLSELDELVRSFEDDERIVLQTLSLIWLSRLSLLAGKTTLAGDAARAALPLVDSLNIRSEEAALLVACAEIATHEGEVGEAVRFAERARAVAGHAWYAADVERTRAFADIALARAAFLGHDNAIARDLALRAAQSNGSPALRALAAAEASVYATLAGDAAGALLGTARDAIAAATPVDGADAVFLATAADVTAFVAAAERIELAPIPAVDTAFSRLIERRRGLVTLEHAGIALANVRTGQGTQTAFDVAIERIGADGPRFEARLARAYATPFARPAPALQPSAPAFDLTAREHEILGLLVEGLSNKEIAERLVLSPRTAETHVERVLGKLEVPSRSRAIAKALRLGIVSLTEA
jgi:LuxR family maltose regulon positive regulatory protein